MSFGQSILYTNVDFADDVYLLAELLERAWSLY